MGPKLPRCRQGKGTTAKLPGELLDRGDRKHPVERVDIGDVGDHAFNGKNALAEQ